MQISGHNPFDVGSWGHSDSTARAQLPCFEPLYHKIFWIWWIVKQKSAQRFLQWLWTCFRQKTSWFTCFFLILHSIFIIEIGIPRCRLFVAAAFEDGSAAVWSAFCSSYLELLGAGMDFFYTRGSKEKKDISPWHLYSHWDKDILHLYHLAPSCEELVSALWIKDYVTHWYLHVSWQKIMDLRFVFHVLDRELFSLSWGVESGKLERHNFFCAFLGPVSVGSGVDCKTLDAGTLSVDMVQWSLWPSLSLGAQCSET